MLALLALTCSSLLWSASHATAQACNPGIQYFDLDGFTTAATISDGPLGAPVDFLLRGEVALARRILAARGLDPDFFQAGNNILYLESDSERILFDTGNGPSAGFGAPGELLPTLEAQGIPAESITRILLSHAHADHTSGLFLDGNGTLAFPNAVIHMSRVEFEYWMGEGAPFSEQDIPPERLLPQAEAIAETLELLESQIELFEFGDEILPNITAVRSAPWHTPGSTIFRIAGGSGPAVFFLGDAVIDSVLGFGHPYLPVVFDTNVTAAAAGRVHLLDAIVANGGLAVPSHVQFPALGRVLPSGVYFEFVRVPPPSVGGVATMCPAPGADFPEREM